MAFYDEMQQMARDLLKPGTAGGLGQGVIKLIRVVESTPNPEQPWLPVETVTQEQPLKGAVKGVRASLVGVEVGGTVIVASDREAICEVPNGEYSVNDTLNVDGVSCQILSVQNIPEAGTVAAVRFVIRG